jgi:hypothetical protein
MSKLNAAAYAAEIKTPRNADAYASYKKSSRHPVTLYVLQRSNVPSFVDAFRAIKQEKM